jgi:hypothetical protein
MVLDKTLFGPMKQVACSNSLYFSFNIASVIMS